MEGIDCRSAEGTLRRVDRVFSRCGLALNLISRECRKADIANFYIKLTAAVQHENAADLGEI